MRSTILSRTRRWLGASALALIAGAGGVSTAFVLTGQAANAQVQNAAEIVVPQTTVQQGFADLVEAVKPAVVSILVEAEAPGRTVQRGGRDFNFEFNFPDLPENHPFREFFDQFGGPGPRVPGENARPRQFMAAGSGFIISADGYVVTNNHVVADATKVTVVFEDGSEQVAEIVGTDERTDLAVLKIEGDDLPFVTFESDDQPSRVGDWVVAVGNPFGLGGTVTVGVISGAGRDIGGSNYGDFLQIDAAVNTGNSGGPAFNTRGEVVGVNTAIYSPTGGNVGIAFAIPARTVQQIVNQLIEDGTVTRGYLGVSIQDVSSDIADSVGLPNARGAIVREPTEDGPAGSAGVRSGDIILEVDGEEIEDALDLSRTIASKAPDSTVELTIWRDGAETTISVTLQQLEEDTAAATPERPTPPNALPEATTSLGMTLVPNGDGSGGLLIQNVDPESQAAQRGLATGDVILEVDNQAVSTPREFDQAVAGVREKGLSTALVKVARDGEARFIGLPIAEEQ